MNKILNTNKLLSLLIDIYNLDKNLWDNKINLPDLINNFILKNLIIKRKVYIYYLTMLRLYS